MVNRCIVTSLKGTRMGKLYDPEVTIRTILEFVGEENISDSHQLAAHLFTQLKNPPKTIRLGVYENPVSLDSQFRIFHDNNGDQLSYQMLIFNKTRGSCSFRFQIVGDQQTSNNADLFKLVEQAVDVITRGKLCKGCNLLCPGEVCTSCVTIFNPTPCHLCGVHFGFLKRNNVHRHCSTKRVKENKKRQPL